MCILPHQTPPPPPKSDTPAFQQQALARALADVIRISVEKISRGETLDLNALRNKAAAMNGMRVQKRISDPIRMLQYKCACVRGCVHEFAVADLRTCWDRNHFGYF
jgi:hypothetical protein